MKDLTKKYQDRLKKSMPRRVSSEEVWDGGKGMYYSNGVVRNNLVKDTTTVIAWVTAVLLTVYLFVFNFTALLILAGIVLATWLSDKLEGRL